ncbi:MAG: response regulator, partial [Candidatus Wallbacteria bacterium]|nr:response regulator [Candidatus Wallbacteria bacterium]
MGRILIVDDRPLNREYLVAVLRSEGHVLLEAADGREALDIAEHVKPQLVITDIMMPEMDGPELVRRLRANPDLQDIPVVFYTATYLESEARALAANCGVEYVLLKPSPARLILALVRKCLGASATSDHSEELPGPIDITQEKPTAERQIVSQLAELLELSDRVSRETAPQVLLQKLCRGARYVLGASFVAAVILDERSPAFSSSGLGPGSRWGEAGLLVESALCRRLLASKRPLRSSNASELAEALGLPTEAVEGQTLVGAPVASSGHLIGLLCFAGKLGGIAFSEHDERLVETLATQLAVSYETATLRDN